MYWFILDAQRMSCQLDAVGFLFYFLRHLSRNIFHVVKLQFFEHENVVVDPWELTNNDLF